MEKEEHGVVVVEGDWAPEQNRTVKNKLLKHFQSEKKSGGCGECRVELVEGVARATVLFTSRAVRDRVLSKPHHEISLEQKNVKLHLRVDSGGAEEVQTPSDSVPDPQKSDVQPQGHEVQTQQSKPDRGSSAGRHGGCSVALGPVSEDTSRDLLCILVEHVFGSEEPEYDLELVSEKSLAVVTFRNHTEAEKFTSLSRSSGKLQKRGLSATLLEPATSVRVENLPQSVVKDMLDLHFEKHFEAPDDIKMIPEEQAAVLTFTDPKVVKDICSKTDLAIKSTPIKVYPYYTSLGLALMGADRPEFKMPDAFTEIVHVPIWRFLRSKNLSDSINRNMESFFCHVDMSSPQVKLSPLPSFLRQSDLTKGRVENWKPTALKAFREQVNEYGSFECPVVSVALGPVSEDTSRDLLCILVEHVFGSEEPEYDLELVSEKSLAVVTFRNHTEAEKFTSLSRSSGKLQKRGLSATLLEPATSVRVENLPQSVIKDMLDLHFEKHFEAPDDIKMIPEEQAAVLTFTDPKVVKDICSKTDLAIKSTPIKVYPYYTSLGLALMGADRPEFKMPDAFTEIVHVPIWRFLRSKNLSDSINRNMESFFCHVDMSSPQVKLSPLPSFLRQSDLTKGRVENWKPTALKAFREQVNEYGSFECPVVSVALGPVSEDTSRDLLCILVEHVFGSEEPEYDLELVSEKSLAVVTFRNHTEAEKFTSLSRSSGKLQKRGLSATLLEPATSVRVENLPQSVVKDMLDLHFEKHFEAPDDIKMIPEEQAAVLTFTDPKVVKDICSKTDLAIKSTPIKVYPYYTSLGLALMGADRPEFKMPDAFTEIVHVPIWRFLRSKNLSDSINRNMESFFCHVDMSSPQVKLSPLPSFLRQSDLTKGRVENWKPTALKAFREQVNEYGSFECPVGSAAWALAEEQVRAIVNDEAELNLDPTKDVLTVAASFKTIRRIRTDVEATVRKAVKQIDREMNGVKEKMPLAPAMFHILNESGLKKAVQDICPDIILDFDKGVLTISGMKGEVFNLKSWILEKTMALEKKLLDMPNPLQDFLKNVDVKQLSQDQFTSKGICACIGLEPKGIFLLGTSERFICDAERKLQSLFEVKVLNCPDKEVMKLKKWSDLRETLLDSYNTSNKQSVQVQIQGQKITIAGFSVPVKEVAQNLGDFIHNYSRVQERVRVESCAVVHFIEKKKNEEWAQIAKDNQVSTEFDLKRPKFTISGPRLHVQNAKSLYLKLTGALINDTLQVQKPGAKKFFMNQGALFLSTVLTEFGCAVILRPELPDDDDDEFEEILDVQDGACVVRVNTASGVQVSVRKADMCKLKVDAVVNAANEDLKHIGGLALALLNAAGPEMQRDCDDFIRRNGKLPPGESFATKSYRLPCKHVIHAVGPRYTENGAKLAHFLLNFVIKNSLAEAEKLRCTSVAVPAVSLGIFGFPVDLCAETIAQAVREYCDDPKNKQVALRQVQLVDNNDKTVKALAEAVKTEFSDLKPTMESEQTRVQVQGAVGGSEAGWETVIYEELDEMGRKEVPRERPAGGRIKPRLSGGSGAEWEMMTYEDVGEMRSEEGPRERPTGGRITAPQIKPRLRGSKLEQTTPEGLRVSLVKGNIQEQTTEVIVNTIGENMNLQQGAVSKAMLQAAGPRLQAAVLLSVSEDLVSFGEVVITDGFNLRCKKVFHAMCPPWDKGAGPAQTMLEDIIRSCLEEAERQRLRSLSFPALGTGNLHFPRNVVSALILREVHVFSRAHRPQHLRDVQVVVHPTDTQTVECFTKEFKGQNSPIIQSEAEFEQSPQTSRQSQPSSDFMSSPLKSLLGLSDGPVRDVPVLKGQEFEPTVFQLCAETQRAIVQAKKRIEDLIQTEQDQRTISDPILIHLTQSDVKRLDELQRSLTVKIRLERKNKEEPSIHLEGLARDVSTAESAVRDMIRKVERAENRRKEAFMLSGVIEWQLVQNNGDKTPFDEMTNLTLEEAFVQKKTIKITINGKPFTANPGRMRADCQRTRKTMELVRVECKVWYIQPTHDSSESDLGQQPTINTTTYDITGLMSNDADDASLPSEWSDMKGDLVKLVPLQTGSKEFQKVETLVTQLNLNIVSIERVQNTSLWKNYQIKKKEMDTKNKSNNNEKVLFHGTGHKSIDLINKQGFNRSYAGANAAMHGNGSYFAVDPAYSVRGYSKPDSKGHRRLYVALVLVGEYTKGQAGMITPPAKSNPSDLYDSVTDRMPNPSMFIIFNDVQAYPQYLITFT